jgi:hypothetical protein
MGYWYLLPIGERIYRLGSHPAVKKFLASTGKALSSLKKVKSTKPPKPPGKGKNIYRATMAASFTPDSDAPTRQPPKPGKVKTVAATRPKVAGTKKKKPSKPKVIKR